MGRVTFRSDSATLAGSAWASIAPSLISVRAAASSSGSRMSAPISSRSVLRVR
ncbi:Uncharacterised protein [Mycobacteroides abscessus subsp. abscessus]|nr:Uncharacterised protein [Mycobacteroides abscessus subsp. abscessus]